jgi:lactoylglutathione lyase
VEDIEKAKQWYSEILGVPPYFDQPYYVGFNIGGYELGLDPDAAGITKGNNVVAYWSVEKIELVYNHILALGAKKNGDIQNVGGNIQVATVIDPFGNIFGLIENPDFK